ncbi:MAG TPA: penicillin acylase family protein [Steroidobacteraceae bacterium]|nr:penicillin acylase family protein [Steroidobacteraceae bacterium]
MRLLKYVAGALSILIVVAASLVYFTLRASLPQIGGTLANAKIASSATIERDAYGVPTIRAKTRADLAFATGVAHAQDRFFQMDLMRRAAAGELAELLGPAVLETDKHFRIHGFRYVAQQVLRDASDEQRRWIDAYVAGVNFALTHARSRPWEYLLLRQQPRAWRADDCLLVAFSMYLDLNDSNGAKEVANAQLRASLPPQLYAFIHPPGTEWDAPLSGGVWRGAKIPGSDVIDLRHTNAKFTLAESFEEPDVLGSNNWAVAGTHTADGAALLASDMHLPLRLPNVWYQARLVVEAGGADHRDLVGVTLPGLPLLIAGSNGRVAWSYTNSYGDWTDVVVVEADPLNADRYLTPEGPEPFAVRRERIDVRGAQPHSIDLKATRWGPVVARDASHHDLALAWTAHFPRATNLNLFAFETADSVGELLQLANRGGGPVQNVVAADSQGHIGWTLMGQIPTRGNYDSSVPSSWSASGSGWQGWLAPKAYPRIIDPPSGRLWSANARTLEVDRMTALLGDGGFDLGARAAQIRDDLLALPRATREDMAKIQLDDRALFLARWHDLLLDLLNDGAVAQSDLRRRAQKAVRDWSGRAEVDDVGYRIVRSFRMRVRDEVYSWLTAAARQKFPDGQFAPSAQFEGPLWQIVTERPVHLLPSRFSSWPNALLASLDATLNELQKECGALAKCTWGAANTLAIRHPLSAALPFARVWLDMPSVPVDGDTWMPRVQGPKFGASERMVISPGKEAEALFQMPSGPVDHPLSPFYGAGHSDWVRGKSRALLPGTATNVLTLTPAPQ